MRMISMMMSSTLMSIMPTLMPDRIGMAWMSYGLPLRLAKAVRELA